MRQCVEVKLVCDYNENTMGLGMTSSIENAVEEDNAQSSEGIVVGGLRCR